MVKNMRKKHRYRGGGKVGVGTEILKSVVSQETPINRNLIKGKVKRELRRNGDQRHSLDWAESVERDYYGGDSPLREMGIGQQPFNLTRLLLNRDTLSPLSPEDQQRQRDIDRRIGGRIKTALERMAREGPSAGITALVGKPTLDRIGVAVEDRLRPAARRGWDKGGEVFGALEDKLIRGVRGLLGPRDRQSSVYESIAMGRAAGGKIPGYQFGGQWGGSKGMQPGGGGGQWGGGMQQPMGAPPGGFGKQPLMGGPAAPGGGGWGGGMQQPSGMMMAQPGGPGGGPQSGRPPAPQWGGGRFDPWTPATAAGTGSRSDPFLNDPAGLAQYQQQQGGVPGGPDTGPPGSPGGGGQPSPGQPQTAAPPRYQSQAVSPNYARPAAYSGYGGPSDFFSTQSFVSPEVAGDWAAIKSGIMEAGTRPYEAYQGPFIAAPTELEAAAQAGYGAFGKGAGPQATLQAEQTMRDAARGVGSLAPEQAAMARKFGAYAPLAQEQAQAAAAGMTEAGAEAAARARSIGEQAATPEMQREAGALDPYVSQYTEGVLDPQIQAIRDEAARQRAEVASQTAMGGTGGYRRAIEEGMIGQQTTQQIADVTGKAYADAQREARAAFESDRAAQFAGTGQQLTAEQQAASQQAAQQAAAAGMQQQGFGTMSDLWRGQQGALGGEAGLYGQLAGIGGQQATLGGQQQAQQLERLRTMGAAGEKEARRIQAGYDTAREEWQKAKDDPEKRLDWMRRQMSGLPYQNITHQARYNPMLSSGERALGAGIAGAGMWAAQNQPVETTGGRHGFSLAGLGRDLFPSGPPGQQPETTSPRTGAVFPQGHPQAGQPDPHGYGAYYRYQQQQEAAAAAAEAAAQREAKFFGG